MATQPPPRKNGPSCFPSRRKVHSLRKRISGWEISIGNRERQRPRSAKCRSSKGFRPTPISRKHRAKNNLSTSKCNRHLGGHSRKFDLSNRGTRAGDRER